MNCCASFVWSPTGFGRVASPGPFDQHVIETIETTVASGDGVSDDWYCFGQHGGDVFR